MQAFAQFYGILITILGFGVLILVHELGHFLVAKKVGIRCPQFAIGFGQALVSWRRGLGIQVGSTEAEYRKKLLEKLGPPQGITGTAEEEAKQLAMLDLAELLGQYPDDELEAAEAELGLGETEYRLNWMPLGGYVKMLGQEDGNPNAKSSSPRAYNRKPVGARAWVISAGVIVNLVFGFFLFIPAFMMGVQFPAAQVGGTAPTLPAASTYATGHEGDPAYLGMQLGDVITEVNGKPATELAEVRLATALGEPGKPVTLTVDRFGEAGPLAFTFTPRPDRQEKLLAAGIAPPIKLEVSEELPPDSEPWARGLRPGMRLIAINNQPVASVSEFRHRFASSAGQPLELGFEHPDTKATLTLTEQAEPKLIPTPEGPASLLGLRPLAKINFVDETAPAGQAGVLPGDILAQIGQTHWPSTINQVIAEVSGAGNNPVAIVVMRDGQRMDLGGVTPSKGLLGISVQPALDTPRLAPILDDSVADQSTAEAVPAYSKITAINGSPVTDWVGIQQAMALAAHNGDNEIDVALELALPQSPVQALSLVLSDTTRRQLAAASWGIPNSPLGFGRDTITIQTLNPIEAAGIGLVKTKMFVQQTYITLARLFQGSVKVSHLRGPVGIVHIGSDVSKQGIAYFLYFMGLISINLAVINFLPFPIVDGGHMVFLILEKIRGKPLPMKVQAAALYAGLAVIAVLFLTITFYDIERLIPG